MPHNNEILTAPLHFKNDIGYIVGTGSGDNDTNVLQGNINKWSKYKPVRHSKIGSITEADRKSVNYGLKISKFTNLTALINGIAGGTEWSYQRPTVNDPHRSTDFVPYNPSSSTPYAGNGYNKNARCFIEEAQVPSNYTQGFGGAVLRLYMTPQVQLPSGTVHWSDLTNLNDESIELDDCYFGALFVKGTSYMYLTSSSKLNSNSYVAEIEIPAATLDALATGTWSVYLCFAYTAQSTPIYNSGDINNAMRLGVYAVPDVGVSSMTVSAPATAASAAIKDNLVDVTFVGVRFSVAFGINYIASSTQTPIYATYKIYGGDESGAKTTLYVTSAEITLTATTTLQTYNVNEQNIRPSGFPNYVTVELTFKVGSSSQVYTAPEVSVPFPTDEPE